MHLNKVTVALAAKRPIPGTAGNAGGAARCGPSPCRAPDPRLEAFRTWCEHQLARIPGRGDLAKAMRYALNRWKAFILFLDDARVAIDNNPAERAIRPIALGRKNFLFAGSDAGGEILADAMTVIETAKLASLDPETYLAELLGRIRDHDRARLDDLLPWNWKTQRRTTAETA